MTAITARVLVIEDDAKTAGAICTGLRAEGYDVSVASTGEEGVSRCAATRFDLVLLDWRLPGSDGIAVLRSLRGAGARARVLMLTARDAIEDRVLGLDSGADDYLVKPFAIAELSARIRVLLRRAGDEDGLRRQLDDLLVDMESRRVYRGDEEIALTPREFDLLAYLMRNHGRIVTRRMLAKDVWRETQRATPLDNVVDVHIAHLRRKIDDGRERKLLHTVRGVGFTLRAESST